MVADEPPVAPVAPLAPGDVTRDGPSPGVVRNIAQLSVRVGQYSAIRPAPHEFRDARADGASYGHQASYALSRHSEIATRNAGTRRAIGLGD